MVWLCEFRGGINSWDLKILYKDLESWKNGWKKIEWNKMDCRIRKVEKKNNKKKEWVKWGNQTMRILVRV